MSYIGTNKIGGMHLGSTEIGKAYLGTDLVYQKSSGSSGTNYALEYLTLTALASTTISVKSNNASPNIPTILYSTNGGSSWSSVNLSTTETNLATLSTGNSILLKATHGGGTSSTGYFTIKGTGDFEASGNVMSLIFGDNFIGKTSLSGKDYAFFSLFYQSTNLKNVDNLVLPATTLATSCYQNMFRGTSITSTPKLPAMTLADSCYRYMFGQCASLTTACDLPAITLANYCYRQMFAQCSSLTEAPTRLPASNAPSYCYYTMFGQCSSLKTAPDISATTVGAHCCEYMFYQCILLENVPSSLPATTLADSCYKQMFQGCSKIKVAPVLPATLLVTNCYKYMFTNCVRLNYIKAMFLTTPSTAYTDSWVSSVNYNGTFVKNISATWNVTGASSVPESWTIKTAVQ